MIEDFANLIPKGLLNKSGAAFYSGRDAFEGDSPLYVLGLNPGGSPVHMTRVTVEWHTNKLLTNEPDDWSAYRDETWGKSQRSAMQLRLLHLLDHIHLPPGSVPASNVVFLRSSREAQIQTDFLSLADSCWPFHQEVIERLQPKVVLCFGRTAGGYVRAKLDASRKVDEFVEDNNRRWRSRSFCNPHGVTVIEATHPAIADWRKPATAPTRLVQAALAS
jgi:hypothetical protein